MTDASFIFIHIKKLEKYKTATVWRLVSQD